ncbi:MAG: PQQ-binding-like beta-propeller repeat protein [Caldisericia bacterium]|nr:PQQ-binding-like beta-propeller repeat protein [Caldisericia bacterium]
MRNKISLGLIVVIFFSFAFSSCAKQSGENVSEKIAEKNVLAWAHETPLSPAGQLAIFENLVFSSDVECLDADTGKQLFESNHSKGSTFSPFMHGDSVYVTSNTDSLRCFDSETFELKSIVPTSGPICARPCIIGDQVIVGAQYYGITSRHISNGNVLWEYKIEDPDLSITENASGNLLVGVGKRLFLLDIKTRDVLWNNVSDERFSKVSVHGNKIVATAGAKVLLVDVQSGKTVWEREFDSKPAGHPCVFDDKVFVTTWGDGGYLLELNTGKALWHFDKAKELHPALMHNNQLYFGSRNRMLNAINAVNGQPIWETRTLGELSGKPSVYKNNLIFATVGGYAGVYVCSVSTKDGSPVLGYAIKKDVNPTQLVKDDSIKTGIFNGKIGVFKNDAFMYKSPDDWKIVDSSYPETTMDFFEKNSTVLFKMESSQLSGYAIVDKKTGELKDVLKGQTRVCYMDGSNIVFINDKDLTASLLDTEKVTFSTLPDKPFEFDKYESRPFKSVSLDSRLSIIPIMPGYFLAIDNWDSNNRWDKHDISYTCFDSKMNEVFSFKEDKPLGSIYTSKNRIYFAFHLNGEAPEYFVDCDLAACKTRTWEKRYALQENNSEIPNDAVWYSMDYENFIETESFTPERISSLSGEKLEDVLKMLSKFKEATVFAVFGKQCFLEKTDKPSNNRVLIKIDLSRLH